MMSRAWSVCVVLLVAPALASAKECRDWQTLVLPPDRPSVQITIDTLDVMLPQQVVQADTQLLAEETKAVSEGRELLQRAGKPLPLGDITGAWRIASIQLGKTGGFSYPYFAGRIERAACGYQFIKTKGSQRRSGALLPMQDDDHAMAFLGVSTVNGNSDKHYGPDNRLMGAPSGPDGPVNSAGRLLRIGPDTLLIILDADDRGFELYRLDR